MILLEKIKYCCDATKSNNFKIAHKLCTSDPSKGR